MHGKRLAERHEGQDNGQHLLSSPVHQAGATSEHQMHTSRRSYLSTPPEVLSINQTPVGTLRHEVTQTATTPPNRWMSAR
jgi:bisphosphoglycerate-dependent phosphoglycerate mutase